MKQFNTMMKKQKAEDAKAVAGQFAALMACALALFGIFTIGWFFVPIAFICAVCGTFQSITNGNSRGFFICILAWLLVILGFFTSPSLWVSALVVAAV